jgi:single-strand DNA-binding protein
MASLNKAFLIGNLGKDPEIRVTTAGQTVATFSLATTERIKTKDGKSEDRTEWHRVVLWGKLAEIARDYLHKGKTVYIEGRIQTRKWDDAKGHTNYTTEIVGDNMQMLSPKKETDKGYPASWDAVETDNDITKEIVDYDDVPF